MSPLLGLQGTGGGLGYLAPKGSAAGQPPAGAASFLVFGGATASFDDQIGSLDFTNTGSQMTLSSSTHGGPPGFTNSGLIAGGTGNNTGNVRTADDVIPDLSGDFTIDCCSYNAAGTSTASMMWSVANYSAGPSWYIYNASGNSRFDTAAYDWSGRLGEAGSGNPQHNYVQNKWCVSRLRRSGNTTHVNWYEEHANGLTWQNAPGSSYSGSTTGTGPNIANSSNGRMILNGWAASHGAGGGYSVGSSQVSIAWIVVYASSFTGTPYVP